MGSVGGNAQPGVATAAHSRIVSEPPVFERVCHKRCLGGGALEVIRGREREHYTVPADKADSMNQRKMCTCNSYVNRRSRSVQNELLLLEVVAGSVSVGVQLKRGKCNLTTWQCCNAEAACTLCKNTAQIKSQTLQIMPIPSIIFSISINA